MKRKLSQISDSDLLIYYIEQFNSHLNINTKTNDIIQNAYINNTYCYVSLIYNLIKKDQDLLTIEIKSVIMNSIILFTNSIFEMLVEDNDYDINERNRFLNDWSIWDEEQMNMFIDIIDSRIEKILKGIYREVR